MLVFRKMCCKEYPKFDLDLDLGFVNINFVIKIDSEVQNLKDCCSNKDLMHFILNKNL